MTFTADTVQVALRSCPVRTPEKVTGLRVDAISVGGFRAALVFEFVARFGSRRNFFAALNHFSNDEFRHATTQRYTMKLHYLLARMLRKLGGGTKDGSGLLVPTQ